MFAASARGLVHHHCLILFVNQRSSREKIFWEQKMIKYSNSHITNINRKVAAQSLAIFGHLITFVICTTLNLRHETIKINYEASSHIWLFVMNISTSREQRITAKQYSDVPPSH